MLRMLKSTVLVIIALVLGGAAAQAEIMRLSHHHTVGGQLDRTAHVFAEAIEELTSGELEIQIFPAAQLGQQNEAFEQLNLGVIDMTLSPIGLMDKKYPAVRVANLPFIWDSFEHFERAANGAWRDAMVEGLLENSNTRLLGISGLGFRDMIFRAEPVTNVDGMAGLKMRAPEAHLWIRMFELLDAKPTPVTWGEVYTAMQTGVAAGLEAPALAALDMKFDEVTKSVVLTQHMFATMGICINEDRFEKLSPAFQEAVLEAGAIAAQYLTDDSNAGSEKAYEEMKAKGMAIYPPEGRDAWAAAMKPLWDEVAAENADVPNLIELVLVAK